MIKILITYFFYIIPIVTFSQVKETEQKYKNETKKLISDLVGEIKIDTKTVLINKPISYDLKNCFETTFIESDSLTENEKLYVKKEIENSNEFEWTNDYVDNIKIVKNSEYQKIFKDLINGWKNFRRKHGKSILQFSKPIFLRNYSICIISYSHSSDYLSAYGLTTCYKKENGKWIAFGTTCEWYS